MPENKILLWSGVGVLVRLYQLGLELRPLFERQRLFVYPIYAAIGGSVGYWLQGVEQRQIKRLSKTRDRLLEKRARMAAIDGSNIGNIGNVEELSPAPRPIDPRKP